MNYTVFVLILVVFVLGEFSFTDSLRQADCPPKSAAGRRCCLQFVVASCGLIFFRDVLC